MININVMSKCSECRHDKNKCAFKVGFVMDIGRVKALSLTSITEIDVYCQGYIHNRK